MSTRSVIINIAVNKSNPISLFSYQIDFYEADLLQRREESAYLQKRESQHRNESI